MYRRGEKIEKFKQKTLEKVKQKILRKLRKCKNPPGSACSFCPRGSSCSRQYPGLCTWPKLNIPRSYWVQLVSDPKLGLFSRPVCVLWKSSLISPIGGGWPPVEQLAIHLEAVVGYLPISLSAINSPVRGITTTSTTTHVSLNPIFAVFCVFIW